MDRLVKRDDLLYVESWPALGYHGEEWLVGERGERLGLLSQDVMRGAKVDLARRTMVAAALTAMQSPILVEVCVGLPLHGYDEQGLVLHKLLRGEHGVTTGGRERTLLLKGTVVLDGLGLWVRSLSPDRYVLAPKPLGLPTAVLDFGYRTIQMAVFVGLQMYATPYISSHGTYGLREQVLTQQFEGPGQTMYESPRREVVMTHLPSNGEVSIRGKSVTLDMIRPRLEVFADRVWVRVAEEIRQALEPIPYERVVVRGGGVHLFADRLVEMFGNYVVILRDRFAQAEGYPLFLEHRAMLHEHA